jgi:hypothetical protein
MAYNLDYFLYSRISSGRARLEQTPAVNVCNLCDTSEPSYLKKCIQCEGALQYTLEECNGVRTSFLWHIFLIDYADTQDRKMEVFNLARSVFSRSRDLVAVRFKAKEVDPSPYRAMVLQRDPHGMYSLSFRKMNSRDVENEFSNEMDLAENGWAILEDAVR